MIMYFPLLSEARLSHLFIDFDGNDESLICNRNFFINKIEKTLRLCVKKEFLNLQEYILKQQPKN